MDAILEAVFDAQFLREIRDDLRLMRVIIPELQSLYQDPEDRQALAALGAEFEALSDLIARGPGPENLPMPDL